MILKFFSNIRKPVPFIENDLSRDNVKIQKSPISIGEGRKTLTKTAFHTNKERDNSNYL